MVMQTVGCPQCQTSLRSARALSPTDLIRCPQCGNQFLAQSSLAVAPAFDQPVTVPAPAPAAAFSGRALVMLFIPAALAALLVGAGTIVGTYFLVRSQPTAAPAVDDQRDRELAEKQRQLDERKKDLDAQSEKLNRQKFDTLMRDGKQYLADKKYDDALSTFEGALRLYPNDKDALDNLIAAKAGKAGTTVDSSAGEQQKQRKAAFDKLMDQGQQAMAAKKYAEAIIFFEGAQNLIPAEGASQALADARKELEKDKVEKEKLTAYQQFMAAGKAALTTGRYPDAIREFLGAQAVIPGDAAAVKGQKDAEQKIADAKQQDDFNKLLDNAKTALNNKKYNEAIGGALAALRILPGDPGATKLLDDAKKGLDAATTDYKRFMGAADTARAAGRFEEAQRMLTKALDVLPGDAAALKAQQDLQNRLADLQAGQAAYMRYMATGVQAMNANRYADAVAAFTEALKLVPNDLDAQKGFTDAQTALNAIVARKTDYDRFMALAAAAMAKKLYPDAVVAYRDALIAIPDDPLAIAGLRQAKYLRNMSEGDKALLVKKYGEAIKHYEEALKEVPGDKAAKEQLNSARYQRAMQDGTAALVGKKFADAVSEFEEALRERPNDVNAKLQLHEAKFSRAMADGDAAMRVQKYDDAIAAYQEALRERPNDAKATKALMQAQKLKK